LSALETIMRGALDDRPDVAALACFDGGAGLVLGMFVNGDVPSEVVEMAALSAPELCEVPRIAGQRGFAEEGEACPEAFVASASWVHAFARVPTRPDLVVMGLANAGTNITLLRAWLGEVATKVGRSS
jgi:hypothetical protein